MTQYRIVQRTNEYSVTTFVIQKYSWFKWRDVKLFNNTSIANYKTLEKATEAVDFIIRNPLKDLVVYKQLEE